MNPPVLVFKDRHIHVSGCVLCTTYIILSHTSYTHCSSGLYQRFLDFINKYESVLKILLARYVSFVGRCFLLCSSYVCKFKCVAYKYFVHLPAYPCFLDNMYFNSCTLLHVLSRMIATMWFWCDLLNFRAHAHACISAAVPKLFTLSLSFTISLSLFLSLSLSLSLS